MATINGFTAEKMQEIADSAFKSAEIVGDNLVITHQDDSETIVGNVRGPQGFPGITDIDLYDPVGVPKPRLIPGVPDGYGLCDGTTEYDADLAPILAAAYGTGPACINGPAAVGNIKLPDMRGLTIFGLHPGISAFDTLLETGGSKDAVVVSHEHSATADQPAHSHTGDQPGHDHGGATTVDGSHDHTGVDGAVFVVSVGGPQNERLASSGATDEVGPYVTYTDADDAGNHIHGIPSSDPTISISNADPAISVDVSFEGVSGTDKNLPPFRVANWIMRLA